ncbi:MAG: proline dehydrogenase family protein [Candidatus Tectomicrobia bacterium]|uniref:proline dehydrogenase n=1 Tax=Tectimicrobiota bacterium TaxID=2528274 RepID=A0A932GM90_UNCTE|nr:proline dehydrogenase family protein [Candidatus Tectomicrobia bacterium]
MLRSVLLTLAPHEGVKRFLTEAVQVRRAVQRFVAGETLAEALPAVMALNQQGLPATMDHLGESMVDLWGARRATEAYLELLDVIFRKRISSHISVKLTQLGLDIDTELCLENMRQILDEAARCQNFVRIDMEGSRYTERTLDLFHYLRRSYSNVGVVLQAYLYRTEVDLERLIPLGANIRLCKGAYQESAEIAYPRKSDVDRNFFKLLEILMSPRAQRAGVYAAIATHDEKIIQRARSMANRMGRGLRNFEFQMLYGIRRDLQVRLARAGYQVRIYVPYGGEWYPYFLRRLAERPANLAFFLKNLFRG